MKKNSVYAPFFQAPNLSFVPHGFTTRNGGVHQDPALSSFNLRGSDESTLNNHKILRTDFPKYQFRFINQVHGREFVWNTQIDSEIKTADAHGTQEKGIMVAVGVADCAPVLLASKNGEVVLAIHAGWRGALDRIVHHTVMRVSQETGIATDQFVAAVGPRLGSCCMEIQSDVADLWRQEPGALISRQGKVFLDFSTALKDDFVKLGIKNYWFLDACTGCRPDLFYSYRRDHGRTGRQIGFIGRPFL